MCGLCGVVNVGDADAERVVQRMAETMVRRGPDDHGTWSDAAMGLHLGFRRLSILDTSPAGHQPMASADGRGVLVFNGEIYNHPELRRDLEADGVRLRGHSDTEVLVEWLVRRGKAGLARLNGMFALAYADLRSRTVLLARDHAGIKPLYWATQHGGPGVAFSSRYDALFLTGWLDPDDVDPASLSLYLELTHVPAPHGLHHRTGQVEAGCYVEIDPSGIARSGRWWSPPVVDPDLSGPDALDAVGASLQSAVRRQLVADVPVGVFLSSGIDSPLVAACAATEKPGLSAFTMGSDHGEWSGDERPGAARFAEALGLRHHLANATVDEALVAVDESMTAAHEPMGDYSILSTLLVSKLARRSVTVSLSGDGGDELFFGYQRPLDVLSRSRLWTLPRAARLNLFRARRLPGVPRINEIYTSSSPAEAYRRLHSRLSADARRRLAPSAPTLADPSLYESPSSLDRRSLSDFCRAVEYDLQMQRVLKKVDMASMHHSLEVRVPLLDREVIDTSYRVDLDTHIQGNRRKAVLVDLLARHVSPTTISTKKLGFGAPLSTWLNGPLRERADAALTAPDFYLPHLLDQDAVVALWRGHLAGEHRAWPLWALLSLQWWGRRVTEMVGHRHPLG